MSVGLLYAHGPRYTHLATSARIAENPYHSWTVEEIAKVFTEATSSIQLVK